MLILFVCYAGVITYGYVNLINIALFFGYCFLMINSAKMEERHLTGLRLFFTVFAFALFFVFCFYLCFDYYSNQCFAYNLYDGKDYEMICQKFLGKSISEVYNWVMGRWDYGDLGGPIYMSSLYEVIPSFYFLSFVHIILGAFSAIALFYIGKQIMTSKTYAYLGALSYSISSCALYFYGAHIKETGMCFLIIYSFFFFYKYLANGNTLNLLCCLVFALLVWFFREPVVGFIILSFITYTLYNKKKGRLPLLFLMIVSSITLVFVYPVIDSVFMRYTSGGDLSKGENYYQATSFSILVSTISSLFGPFPEFFSLKQEISSKPFEATGVLIKFLLFPFFWIGLFKALVNKLSAVLPVFIFVVLESVAIAVANDGLEVRKSFPHYSMFFLAAFWTIDYFDNNSDSERELRLMKLFFTYCSALVFVCSLLWNAIR